MQPQQQLNAAAPSYDPASQQHPQQPTESSSHSSTAQQQQHPQQPSQPDILASNPFLAATAASVKIQSKQMALQRAKAARPAEPFESGTSMQYSILMSQFDAVTEGDSLDAREKLLELSLWFKGYAKQIVSSYTIYRTDPEGNYAKARSKLDNLFCLHHDSFDATIEKITRGKQLAPLDYMGHLGLFAELSEAQAMVSTTGNELDFDRRDIIRKIIDSRLDHYATKFWTEDQKSVRQTGRRFTFKDLIDQIQDWMNILSNRGVNEKRSNANNNNNSNNSNNIGNGRNTNNPRQTANVNASSGRRTQTPTASGGYAGKVGNSPPKEQPSTRCGICESYHATTDCQTIANISIDERIKKLGEKGCCFLCFSRGHMARDCQTPPTCGICRKPHNTLLHRSKAPQRCPATSAPTQPQPLMEITMNATTSNEAAPMAPPPHAPVVQPSAPPAPPGI